MLPIPATSNSTLFFCCLPAEVDACVAFPCQAAGTGGASTCTDLPNPAPNSAAGRSCSCAKATSVYEGDIKGCVDVDACVGWPCVQSGPGGAATCADVDAAANSTAGRSCTCVNGGLHQEDGGCVGKDPARLFVNHARVTLPLPLDCTNQDSLQPGEQQMPAWQAYSHIAHAPADQRCLPAEVDACVAYPCQAAGTGGASLCSDLPHPAPNSTAGRSCACQTATSTYNDENTGCVDVDACVSWPCVQSGPGGAATCADIDAAANSTAGRSCTCANGGLYAEATGCPIVGECSASCLLHLCNSPTHILHWSGQQLSHLVAVAGDGWSVGMLCLTGTAV